MIRCLKSARSQNFIIKMYSYIASFNNMSRLQVINLKMAHNSSWNILLKEAR